NGLHRHARRLQHLCGYPAEDQPGDPDETAPDVGQVRGADPQYFLRGESGAANQRGWQVSLCPSRSASEPELAPVSGVYLRVQGTSTFLEVYHIHHRRDPSQIV